MVWRGRLFFWLGEEGDESDDAIDFLSELAHLGPRLLATPRHGRKYINRIAFTKPSHDTPLLWTGEESIWDAVEKIFHRPYWNRI
jgi:hypothetical protein